MTSASPPHSFEVVRRGYSPPQVDQTMSQLVTDLGAMRRELDSERSRRTGLSEQIAALTEQIDSLRAERAQMQASADVGYRGLGTRIEQIFQLAEEEAREAHHGAHAAAEEHRRTAQEEAAAARQGAEIYVAEQRAAAEAEVARILEQARTQAQALRQTAEADATARRQEAESIFDAKRTEAAVAAKELEASLAERRAAAERAHTERVAAAEASLQAAEARSASLTAEADAIRVEADSRARAVLDAANEQAAQAVAAARETARRLREDAERELVVLTERRDTINAQLANIQQLLASMTGSPVAPAAAPPVVTPVAVPTDGLDQIEYIEVEYAEEGEDVGEIEVEFVDLDDDEVVATSGDADPTARASHTAADADDTTVGSEPARAGRQTS